MRGWITISIAILALLGNFSCTSDHSISIEEFGGCDTIGYSYEYDVMPIVRASCMTGTGPGTGCHDAWITSYNSLKTQVDNGTILREVINDRTMPPANNQFGIAALSESEIAVWRCWMLIGAPEN